MHLAILCAIPLTGVWVIATAGTVDVDWQQHGLGPESLPLAACSVSPRGNSSEGRVLSHVTGIIAPRNLAVGPDTGTPASSPGVWTLNIPSTPVADTKYLVLHFTGVVLPGTNRIEVQLGYGLDVFRAGDGAAFWTRPVDTKRLGGADVVVRYFANTATGIARIDSVGIGERHAGTQDPTSLSNCDPFFTDAVYPEPKYDPFWYCADPPQWEAPACVPDPGDVRARAARSVGMIVLPEPADGFLSTCSVTLIDVDEVILAGHCFGSDEEAVGGSVTFDYATDCAGDRLPGYDPVFYKVERVLNHRWNSADGADGDWARLKLATAVSGAAPLQLRPTLPAVGEQVFGIHHPNGAAKKMSLRHGALATVVSSGPSAVTVPTNFHVSGGSSGSCLFDMAGRCVGVLSNGNPCQGANLRYFPSATMLLNFAPPVPQPVTKDVMIVFDRSGSMSELDSTGRSKIEVARDAVSLFVQLVRAGVGNRIGLVSFSTTASSPADVPLTPLTAASKQALVGNPPFAGGKVGALVPFGSTSIGDGLDKARLQLPAGPPGSNGRVILLLTDGMENSAPFIASVAPDLGDMTVHAIGFGSDANLDGERLSGLASSHAGLYTRASSGVSLQKFFSQAFGNIFETGILSDPELTLPADVDFAAPETFGICREDAVTVAVGWDSTAAGLGVNLTTPGGIVIGSRSAGVEASDGRSWTYLRVPLPYGPGEQAGRWNASVFRVRAGGDVVPGFLRGILRRAVPPSPPPLRYFVNVIPTGGPVLRRQFDNRTYYTGDTVDPLVSFGFLTGEWISEANVQLTLSRPNASTGDILSRSGLGGPLTVAGDTIPAREAALGRLGGGDPTSLVDDDIIQLGNDAASTGNFEETGVYGKFLPGRLTAEGEYQFHVRAETTTTGESGGGCVYSREIVWSLHVAIGVDAGATTASTTVTGPGTGVVVVTPRDRYNNSLGPGRGDSITFSGGPGTTVTGPIGDLGNGSYSVPISWTSSGSGVDGGGPVVVITQPERDPVGVKVPLPVDQCERCVPAPDRNRCHITTSCSVAGPALGTMCACRPGYKAASGRVDGQWRVHWDVPGHEHRVYVAPGMECDVLCDEWWKGADGCREVPVKDC